MSAAQFRASLNCFADGLRSGLPRRDPQIAARSAHRTSARAQTASVRFTKTHSNGVRLCRHRSNAVCARTSLQPRCAATSCYRPLLTGRERRSLANSLATFGLRSPCSQASSASSRSSTSLDSLAEAFQIIARHSVTLSASESLRLAVRTLTATVRQHMCERTRDSRESSSDQRPYFAAAL